MIYKPIVGGALIITRPSIGPRLDGLRCGLPLMIVAVRGIAALLVASAAETVLLLALAGSLFAFGTTFVSPVDMARAVDRSDSQRRGAAMATYSLGCQLGFGLGSLAWGILISVAGFPAPFPGGLLSMAGVAFIVWHARADLMQPRSRTSR